MDDHAGRFAVTDTIIGPYRVLEEIDSGGMAHVYRAEDRQGRFGIVALKVMRPEIAMGTEYQLRFRREAKIWSELDHANIVPLLDFSTDLGGAYVAMRYINGCSLHALLADRGALPIDYALPIMKDVLAAVGYAHKKKVIHRDIKPDNVLLDRNGKAYLTDFGIAKPLGATELTNTGARLGTPTYMAPEQIRGLKDVTARADIYAVGVLFYEMLTGKPPFHGDDPIVLSHAHCYEPPAPMKRRGAPFPDELQELVMGCLEKEPRRRPRSAGAVLKTLVKFEQRRTKGTSSRKDGAAVVDPTIVEAAENARRTRRTEVTPLVAVEHRLAPLEPPRPPMRALARLAALVVAAVLMAGLSSSAGLVDGARYVMHLLRRMVQSLTSDAVSADAVEMLRGGNPRLAVLAFERDLQDSPSLRTSVVELCSGEARRAVDEGRLQRAELLASYCARLQPDDPEALLFLARVLLLERRPLEAAREYVRALGLVPNHELLDHLERYGSLVAELPIRERRLAAARFYMAARGLVVGGDAELARPYAVAALRLEPNNQIYRRLLVPPPTAAPRRLR